MKKIIFVIGMLLFVLILSNHKVYASTNDTLDDYTLLESNTVHIEDGGYVVYRTFEKKNVSSFSTYATAYNTEGKKNVTRYDSDNNIEWVYTLTANFWYKDGVTSECTKADYSTTINDSSWKFSDGSASYSGNTAYGKGTFKHKAWFITTDTVDVDIQLSCDIYGNIS